MGRPFDYTSILGMRAIKSLFFFIGEQTDDLLFTFSLNAATSISYCNISMTSNLLIPQNIRDFSSKGTIKDFNLATHKS